MNDWQPIETAPKDGTRILLTNGIFFAAGERAFYIEPATTSDPNEWNRLCLEWHQLYRESDPKDSSGIFTRPKKDAPPKPDMPMVPNPKAGQRREWWQTDNPSAFREEDHASPDYDRSFDTWEPTHWMPLLKPPHASLERKENE